MADGWMQLCPSIRGNGLNYFLIEQINFHTLLHDMYLWNIYTTQKIHRKKCKEIYLVKTQVPKKWRHCLTTSQNWQGSKEFCYICYLLLWSSNLDLPKAGQLEKRHSFVFGFQVTITLDLQKKRRLMFILSKPNC